MKFSWKGYKNLLSTKRWCLQLKIWNLLKRRVTISCDSKIIKLNLGKFYTKMLHFLKWWTLISNEVNIKHSLLIKKVQFLSTRHHSTSGNIVFKTYSHCKNLISYHSIENSRTDTTIKTGYLAIHCYCCPHFCWFCHWPLQPLKSPSSLSYDARHEVHHGVDCRGWSAILTAATVVEWFSSWWAFLMNWCHISRILLLYNY